MPSTDEARINSKASMAQSVSQTTVCSNGLKACRRIVTVSAAVFPDRKQNLVLAGCSFKSAIAKSTKTITEAQEKNHTDPIHPSSRTPLGQLMRRAVTDKHQAGADGTNAPHLPPPKKTSRYFWVSPCIV